MTKKLKVAFVDVDDTLVRSVGVKRIPMPNAIRAVQRMADSGEYVLYCWSSGGGEYAQESAKELGIETCFAGFLPKPDVYLDDQAVAEWRYCEHVLPTDTDSL